MFGHHGLIRPAAWPGAMVALAVCAPLAGQSILYVDDDAPPGGTGQSWETAYRFLQDGLAAAASSGGTVELRIAQGTYLPDHDEADPDGTKLPEDTFAMFGDVAVVGGYAGLGAADPDARDVKLYETILSGDLEGDDLPGFINYEDNSIHVVTIDEAGSAPLLDGLTFTAGHTRPDTYDDGCGVYNVDGSPTLIECRFVKNFSSSYGGGMSSEDNAEPTLIDCAFSSNRGGGFAVGCTGAIVMNCQFAGNQSERCGVGVSIWSNNITLVDCAFTDNVALYDGSGWYSGSGGAACARNSDATFTACLFSGNVAKRNSGAVDIDSYYSSGTGPEFTECTFIGNAAAWRGGGMYVDAYWLPPTLTGCIFTDNSAVDFGGAIANYRTSPTIDACSFVGNSTDGDGGAVYNPSDSNPQITDSEFIENSAWAGGALMNDASSHPHITGCAFSGNQAAFGGAVCNDGHSDPVMTACTFSGNIGEFGGAMYNESLSSPALTGCIFTGNLASFDGGAMCSDWYCTPPAINCLFIDNLATRGGAVFNANCSPTLTNCTLAGNFASVGGGGIFNEGNSNPLLGNSIAWANADISGVTEDAQVGGGNPIISYSCIQGWTGDLGGVGNIGDDPLFVDAEGGDYRLAFGSPCIDAADNTALPAEIETDLAGEARFVDDPYTADTGVGEAPIVDMGAHEYQADACPADVTGDGVVDVLDLLAILAAWDQAGVPEDINGDGVVDVLDLLEVLGGWGPCP